MLAANEQERRVVALWSVASASACACAGAGCLSACASAFSHFPVGLHFKIEYMFDFWMLVPINFIFKINTSSVSK